MALYGSTNASAASPALIAVTSANKTHLALQAATTGRAFIYEWKVGPSGQPFSTDCEIAWNLVRQSTAGTGVAMTVNPLDPADVAALATVTGNFTAEPTGADTGIIDGLGANQRASYRWVVAPGGPGELIIAATAAAGIGIRAKSSAYVGTTTCGYLFRQ